jgi:hypothetical protein
MVRIAFQPQSEAEGVPNTAYGIAWRLAATMLNRRSTS